MFRYMAFISNDGDRQQAEAVQVLVRALRRTGSDWCLACEQGGLMVWIAGAERGAGSAHLLPDGQGVVVGNLFERPAEPHPECVPRTPVLGPDAARAILGSKGRHLIEAYWGVYVAFLRDPASGAKYIVRGPMSNLPCLRTFFRGVRLYFALMDDCAALDEMDFSVNWSFVRARVAASTPVCRETALDQVGSLEMGECEQILPTRVVSETYWHPCEIARREPITSPREAARILRATTMMSINAFAAQHKRLLLRLSGGVDSSIVAGCLARAPSKPEVIGMNYYAPDAAGDERVFARAVAQHAGFELVEHERSPEVSLDTIAAVRRTASPALDLSGFECNRWEFDLAREREASGVCWGALGDALFQRGPATWAAAEYAWRYGLRPHLFGVALDVALFERISVWSVLRDAVRIGILHRPHRFWSPYERANRIHDIQTPEGRLMNEEARVAFEGELQRFIHPWFHSVIGVPVGKLWTIMSLPLETEYDGAFSRVDDPPMLAPLPTQLIVETCLRIPSHFNFAEGWDRAVARNAFSAELPEIVRRRTTKGRPTSWIREVSVRNARFLREFLLEGELVRNGLLNKKKLEQILPGVIAKTQLPNYAIIVDHLYTEAWLRLWAPRRRRAAA